MKLSIGFFTARDEPRLDWVIEALRDQADPDDEIEIVVVDAMLQAERVEYVRDHVVPIDVQVIWRGELARDVLASYQRVMGERGLGMLAQTRAIHRVLVVPPKPSIWQGRYRVTRENWWGAANARNTFLCLASHDYLAFLDDRCHPAPSWLEAVRRGWQTRTSVYAGAYAKLAEVDGSRVIMTDHRQQIMPKGLPNCGGGWLYGCTLCLPLAWALEVNGFEEGNDSVTGEDYLFGLMLENAGHRIDFVTDLAVVQNRDDGDHTKHRYKTLDKGTPPDDKSHAALARFGSRSRTEFTPDLTELRRQLATGGTFPIPDRNADHRDWYDGQLIREM